jgi:hypothetical protein
MHGAGHGFSHRADHGIRRGGQRVGEARRHHDRFSHASIQVHAERAFFDAEMLRAEAAVATLTAEEVRLDRDQVAFPDAPRARPHGVHMATDLMAEDHAGGCRERPFHDAQVRSAQADGDRPDAHFRHSRNRIRLRSKAHVAGAVAAD